MWLAVFDIKKVYVKVWRSGLLHNILSWELSQWIIWMTPSRLGVPGSMVSEAVYDQDSNRRTTTGFINVLQNQFADDTAIVTMNIGI